MTSNKGTENKKAEKGSRKKTPRVLLDVSQFPHDYKGNAIVPDEYFNENLAALPDGTYNESKTYRAYNGGKLYQIGSIPEKDIEIQRAGADATNATLAERKTFSEMLDIGLRKKTETGLSYLEQITVSMMQKAVAGDVKAAQFVRDTIGEMPVSKQQITADVTTEADRALMEKIAKRLHEKDK